MTEAEAVSPSASGRSRGLSWRWGSVVARFDRLEIDLLTLRPSLDEPLRVSAVWPLRGTFLLEQKTLPFEPRSKVELVPGHIWLSAGAAVRAVGQSPRQATDFDAWTNAPPTQKAGFAGDVPARALRAVRSANQARDSRGVRPTSQRVLDGHLLVLDGHPPVLDGHPPVLDGRLLVLDGSLPVLDGSSRG